MGREFTLVGYPYSLFSRWKYPVNFLLHGINKSDKAGIDVKFIQGVYDYLAPDLVSLLHADIEIS